MLKAEFPRTKMAYLKEKNGKSKEKIKLITREYRSFTLCEHGREALESMIVRMDERYSLTLRTAKKLKMNRMK